jgi:hypothetical protein
MHLAGFAFEEGDLLGDDDAGEPALEQLLEGKAPAPVIHRHDDFFDGVLARVFGQSIGYAYQALFGYDDFFTIGRYEAQQLESALVGAAPQLCEPHRVVARAVDQHSPLEDVFIDSPLRYGAYEHQQQPGDGHRREEFERAVFVGGPESEDQPCQHASDQHAEGDAQDDARHAIAHAPREQTHRDHGYDYQATKYDGLRPVHRLG